MTKLGYACVRHEQLKLFQTSPIVSVNKVRTMRRDVNYLYQYSREGLDCVKVIYNVVCLRCKRVSNIIENVRNSRGSDRVDSRPANATLTMSWNLDHLEC